jgi:hypothetical protein
VVNKSEEVFNEGDSLNTIVTITDGVIQNENLIDEFINDTNGTTKSEKELNIKSDNDNIKVVFTPGQNAFIDEEDGTKIADAGDGSFESNKKLNGYYSLYLNNELIRELPLYTWYIGRVVKDNMVILRFETIADVTSEDALPIICSYNIESSNYEKKFELSYNQRKDLGIYTIAEKNEFDNEDYEIKTFGGNVDITIENDMVYSLKDALNQGVITCDDIINQANNDAKYGICSKGDYSDGGSTEYYYNKYTILKLNTLDGDKDLVIGMQGAILSSYNKNYTMDANLKKSIEEIIYE